MNALIAWPLIVILVGIVACIVALLWGSARFFTADQWMHVSTVDEYGKQIGKGKWERIPKPDKVDVNGLNHVVKYVARMVNRFLTAPGNAQAGPCKSRIDLEVHGDLFEANRRGIETV
jgi:hypothetical protein